MGVSVQRIVECVLIFVGGDMQSAWVKTAMKTDENFGKKKRRRAHISCHWRKQHGHGLLLESFGGFELMRDSGSGMASDLKLAPINVQMDPNCCIVRFDSGRLGTHRVLIGALSFDLAC